MRKTTMRHNRQILRTLVVGLALLTIVQFASRPALGQDAPSKGFSVHDISVWVLEPNLALANARTLFPSALPVNVRTLRTTSAAAKGRLKPLGLLTFHGQGVKNLDVDLRLKSGAFLAHLPSGDAQQRRLHWSGAQGLELIEKLADGDTAGSAELQSWFADAPPGNPLFVRRQGRVERFVAYDAELTLAPPIRLEGGPDTFTITNVSSAALHDILICGKTPQGVRVAWLDEAPKADVLLAAGGSSPSGTTEPSKPPLSPAVSEALGQVAGGLSLIPRAEKLSTVNSLSAKPRGANASKPSADTKRPITMTLSGPIAADAGNFNEQTRAAFAARLTRAGLTRDEADWFAASYAPALFEGEGVVVACRLDAGVMDEIVPLAVFPRPEKTLRVPIVIMRNADPRLGAEIDVLVAQLGDPKFNVRETAQKRLVELGPLTFPALQKAINSPDLEIVIRAERILLNQNQIPNGQGRPAQRGAPVAPPPVRAR